jgi:hypothetical protein
MLKVEYSLVPTDQVFFMKGTASRVMTSNLLNNKNIEVSFPKACLNVDYKFYKYMEENFEDIKKTAPFNLRISMHPWLIFTSKYILTEEYRKTVLEHFKEEVIILTVTHLLDLITVKYLLEDNRKVVIGGSTIILFGIEYIRYMLQLMGATKLHNLLVIRGYVDLHTDLYPLIKKWEDCEIHMTDQQSLWDCRDDFVYEQSHLSNLIYKRDKYCNRFSYLTSILTLECWWGKCMYCSYRDLPVFDFRSSTDIMTEALIDVLTKAGDTSLRFTDSYFEFDDQNIALLENLKDYDVRVVGGIHRMKDPEYVKQFNKYSQMISLGLESVDGDCLQRVKKGINEKMIWAMVNNLIEYVDRDKDIVFCMIADLPFKNEDHVRYNYDTAYHLKRKLEDNGFNNVYYNFSLLQIDETNRERMFSLPQIREPVDFISGRYKFFEYITDHDPIYMTKVFMPFSRYDDKGNLMLSDYDIIGKEFEYLINTKGELDARNN